MDNNCWLCGREGLNYKHFYRRLLIGTMKIKLVGEKPGHEDFIDHLNQAAGTGGPVLVAVKVDADFLAHCSASMVEDAKQLVTGLACGWCVARHGLVQGPMYGAEVFDINEIAARAREELAEEISDFVQKTLDSGGK